MSQSVADPNVLTMIAGVAVDALVFLRRTTASICAHGALGCADSLADLHGGANTYAGAKRDRNLDNRSDQHGSRRRWSRHAPPPQPIFPLRFPRVLMPVA